MAIGDTSRPLRVLFVCSMNQWRSPTAEQLYRLDPRLEVRSAGTRSGAKRRVSEADLGWADVVFAMDRGHKNWIAAQFRHLELPRIVVLDIPDVYRYMDPLLQDALRASIDPELASMLPSGDKTA